MGQTEGRDVIEDYKTIREELKNYDKKLYDKYELIVANKMDVPGSSDNLKRFKEAYPNKEVIEISAATTMGLKDLTYKLKDILITIPDEKIYDEEEKEDYVLYEFKKVKPYHIEQKGNKWIISGSELEKLLKMTRFNSDEAALRFAKKLEKLGVDDELRNLGAKHGDIVCILDQEFEFEDRLV